jgi:type III secretion system YopN/LcrE/InvE/MxiC family regulator
MSDIAHIPDHLPQVYTAPAPEPAQESGHQQASASDGHHDGSSFRDLVGPGEMPLEPEGTSPAGQRFNRHHRRHRQQDVQRRNASELRGAYPTERLRRIYRMSRMLRGDQELDDEADALLAALTGGSSRDSDGQRDDDELSHYIALRAAQDKAEQGGDAALKARIAQAIDDLVNGGGGRVLAGLNTSEALAEFDHRLEQREALRQTYYDTIVGGRSVLDIFDRLLASFGCDRLEHAVKVLRDAIVQDMSAPLTSIDRTRLFTYHYDLNRVVVLRALIADMEALAPVLPMLKQKKTLSRAVRKVLRYVREASSALFLELCVCVEYGDGVAPQDEGAQERTLAVSDATKRRIEQFLRRKLPHFLWTDLPMRSKGLDMAH